MSKVLVFSVSSLLAIAPLSWAMDASLCHVMSDQKERNLCLSRYDKGHFNKAQAKQAAENRNAAKQEQWRQQQLKETARIMKPDPSQREPLVTSNDFGIIRFQILNVKARYYAVCTTYDIFNTVLTQDRILVKPDQTNYSIRTNYSVFPARVGCRSI